jgi:hypothetical protein
MIAACRSGLDSRRAVGGQPGADIVGQFGQVDKPVLVAVGVALQSLGDVRGKCRSAGFRQILRALQFGIRHEHPQTGIARVLNHRTDLLRRALGKNPQPRMMDRPSGVQEDQLRLGGTAPDAVQNPFQRVAADAFIGRIEIAAQQLNLPAHRNQLRPEPDQQDVRRFDLEPFQPVELLVQRSDRSQDAPPVRLVAAQQFEIGKMQQRQVLLGRRRAQFRLAVRRRRKQKMDAGMLERQQQQIAEQPSHADHHQHRQQTVQQPPPRAAARFGRSPGVSFHGRCKKT